MQQAGKRKKMKEPFGTRRGADRGEEEARPKDAPTTL
jgi:hypothetical protein